MTFLYDARVIVSSLVSATLVSYVVRSIWVKWQNARVAERLGCLPPPRLPNKWPLGIDIVRGTIAANQEMRGLEHIRSLLEGMGGTLSNGFQIGFIKGDIRRNVMFPLLGDGIFTQDGPAWWHSRALLRPAFARRQISDLELEEKHIQNLMACLPTDPSNDNWTEEVDLQPLFFRFTLDSSTEYLFGGTVNSQLQMRDVTISHNREGRDLIDFGKQFEAATSALGVRAEFIEFGRYIWPSGFRQACNECHQFVDSYIQKQLARLNNTSIQPRDSKSGKYVFFEALAADVKDPIELRFQLLNILLAGRDTTAGLLAFIFYSLARDPARYQKLREVVLLDFGAYDEDPKQRISFESLKSCKYLQYVIDETLRLYPIVPSNSRLAVRNTTLPRGGGPDGKSKTFVEKGSIVSYSVYIMHRRRDIWGEDADEFNPERWEGRKVGWEYLPFNGGPRICLGQQFALTKAAYTTVRLVQRFDAIENLDFEPVKHRMALTLSSGTGVKVRLHEAR